MATVIENWQTYLTINLGRAASTRKLYLRNLELLEEEMGDPSTLTTDDLRAWLHRRGGSASSVSNRISALNSFYGYLVKARIRIDDPSRPLEAPKRRAAVPDQIQDLNVVWEQLDQSDRIANEVGAIPRRVGESRDMAIFLAETGMRIGEAVACNWPVPCPPTVTVIGKAHTEITVTVSKPAREAWDRLGGKWPTGARATQRRFEKVGIHPHQLRHWHKANRRNHSSSSAHENQATPLVLDALLSKYDENGRQVIVSFLTDLMALFETRIRSSPGDEEE